jgi:cobalt/nickel transport system permease protein
MSDPSPTPAGALPDPPPKSLLARYWWVAGLAIAGLVAALAAAFASGDPDGLDSVAIEKGFEEAGKDRGFQILPGYTIPGIDGTVSTIIAGIVGIVIVFLLVFLLGRLLARRRKDGAA